MPAQRRSVYQLYAQTAASGVLFNRFKKKEQDVNIYIKVLPRLKDIKPLSIFLFIAIIIIWWTDLIDIKFKYTRNNMQTCSILSSYLIEVELSFNKCVQSGRSVITHKLIINLLLIAQCNGFKMKQCCSLKFGFGLENLLNRSSFSLRWRESWIFISRALKTVTAGTSLCYTVSLLNDGFYETLENVMFPKDCELI